VLPKATLTGNALSYDKPPTFEEWQAHGKALQSCSGSVLWWIGDWFVWGEKQFGEEAYQAVGDYEPETVRNAVFVCSRVGQSNRVSLGFWHHSAVAALDDEQQKRWLAKAEELELTVRELRASIKTGRVVLQAEIEAQKLIAPALTDVGVVFHSPEWMRWEKQKWPERDSLPLAVRREWLRELEVPAKMYETLRKELEQEE
jgi:hypothetical protein